MQHKPTETKSVHPRSFPWILNEWADFHDFETLLSGKRPGNYVLPGG